MNRAGIILGLLAVIGLAVLGYLLWSESKPPPRPLTAEEAPQPAPQEPLAGDSEANPPVESELARIAPEPPAPEPAGTERASEPTPDAREPAASPAPARPEAPADEPLTVVPRQEPPSQEAARPAPVAPSFDVVRVERSGETVLAGRAAPGSLVAVLDGERRLGEVRANAQGEWVLVLDPPLGPGTHELGLEVRTGSGERMLSPHIVVVVVPAPAPQAVAAGPAETAAEAQAPAGPPAPTRAEGPAGAPAPAVTHAPGEMQTALAPLAPAPAAPAGPAPGTRGERLDQVGSVGESLSRLAQTGQVQQPLAVLMPRHGQGPIRVLPQSEPALEGLAQGTLLLETVDYDAAGTASVGGRAEPGARLVVYLDGGPVGQATAGPEGHWRVTLDRAVPIGLHRLRVDQVDAAGRVTARVETPFSRVALVAALPDETSVVVQPGNSLWRIARRIYGEGLRYTVIYRANQNQIGDPDLIYPGQIFVVPPIE